MALNDEIIAILIAIAFNYLVVSKHNKFFANIAYIGIGVMTLAYGYTDEVTRSMPIVTLGILVFAGGIGGVIYEVLEMTGKSAKK